MLSKIFYIRECFKKYSLFKRIGFLTFTKETYENKIIFNDVLGRST